MSKKLVIVESPSKSKTIEQYLGEGYVVKSSKGHVRDLAITGAGGLGIDVANDFKPQYEIIPLKKPVVKELNEAAKKAKEIYLATDPDSIRSAVAHAETECGAVDILVNNSGVSTTQRIIDVTPEDYDYMMDTNTRGAFFVAQEVGKRMIARAKGAAPGTFTGGRIVNIASVGGLKVLGQIGVYCMSKAAVVHMTRAMALEWGRYGINVNALCPGYIDTEINHHHWGTEQGKKLVDMMPRKRVGQPKDLDTALLMLCANESHFINGAVLQADDGFGL
jgi:NAD(P)-dependent dehydrogenase (short-subunit alcohol dehydrogenase family)